MRISYPSNIKHGNQVIGGLFLVVKIQENGLNYIYLHFSILLPHIYFDISLGFGQ